MRADCPPAVLDGLASSIGTHLPNKGLDLSEKYPKARALSTALHLNRAAVSMND